MKQGSGGYELKVVMPVYNEGEVITSVIDQWIKILDRLETKYLLCVYNDGSRDNTASVLAAESARWPNVAICNKPNSGHGPTILQGYRESGDAAWIFQTDSDDEMSPESFGKLWRERESYDFLMGQRENRVSPLSRRLVSAISRMAVRIFYGSGIYDVNSPFRLMRSSFFKTCFNSIPPDTFAPNVVVTGYACMKRARIYEIPVPHTPRQTGTVSIKKWKLFKAAARSFMQTIRCRTIVQ